MLRFLFRPVSCGQLFGIPIQVAPAVFVLATIAIFVASGESNRHAFSVLLALLILAVTLLVHEFAHALVAKRLGLKVLDITIWPLGGMARMEGLSGHSSREALVAAAGPLANLVLAAICAFIPGNLAHAAFFMNLVLGLGNLVPAFPLDGGRLLRAWLARRAPLVDATLASVRLAKVIALLALLFCFWGSSIWIGVILAIYLWWSGQVEFVQVMLREAQRPTLTSTEVWRRACYPLFGGTKPQSVYGASEPPAAPVEEELENFHGSLDEFFQDRDSK
ncbi:MAG: M50 family metallopeptidase [Planctomycetota bacterium]|jgi:Zn-dependent protease|nr:M50 family metallopeptidase [Planctomycetota bacterium]